MYKNKLSILIKGLTADGFQYLHVVDRITGNIPATCGVYCFIALSPLDYGGEVIYIGKSDNFSTRLAPWHEIEYKFENTPLCYIKPCENNTVVEADLIRRYRPKFNVQHNQKARRLITYA